MGYAMGGHGSPWEVEFTIGYITEIDIGHGRPWQVEARIPVLTEKFNGLGSPWEATGGGGEQRP